MSCNPSSTLQKFSLPLRRTFTRLHERGPNDVVVTVSNVHPDELIGWGGTENIVCASNCNDACQKGSTLTNIFRSSTSFDIGKRSTTFTTGSRVGPRYHCRQVYSRISQHTRGVQFDVVGTCHPPSPCYEARAAALAAGFPASVPVQTVNRLCGSGLMALRHVSDSIRSGDIDIGVAIGYESMSTQ